MPNKRILLVEDEPEIGDLLALFLRGVGYAVDVARTLAQGRAWLDGLAAYSLVIADLRLPDGDGLEVVDRAATLGVKTSILSGYLFQLPPATAGRHQLLMKPMRPSELIAAVQRSIGPAHGA
jgi:DNA-binding response OmpR family regulator